MRQTAELVNMWWDKHVKVVYWGSHRHFWRFCLMHVPFSVTNLYICVFSPVFFFDSPFFIFLLTRGGHISVYICPLLRPRPEGPRWAQSCKCLIWDFVLLSGNDLCVSLSANTGWSGCEGGLWISVCRRDEQQWTQHTCPNATGCASYTFTFGETALSWSSSHPRPQQGHMILATHTDTN